MPLARCLAALAAAWVLLTFRADAAADPATLLRAYVQAVVNLNTAGLREVATIEQYRSVVNDSGGLDDSLGFIAAYGNPKAVRITDSRTYSAFTVHVAEVEHTAGRSDWVFRLDASGEKIGSAVCLTSPRPEAIDFDKSGFGLKPLRNKGGTMADIGMSEFWQGGGGSSKQIGSIIKNPYDVIVEDLAKRYTRREVDFLFVTDRKPAPSSNSVAFSGVRHPQLSFGAVTVRIPDNHKTGNVELPRSWKVFSFELYREKQNDTKHFSLKRAAFLSEQDFDALVREHDHKTALIFVHGFNNSFEDAVFRNAQMLWDLDYRGLPVLFAWSTRGDGITDYGFDRDSALFARDGFIRLVQKLQNDLGVERIDVLAHSMGNLVVVDALSTNALVAKPVQIDRLVMAAPDLDTEGFKKAIPVLKKITQDMTLYASSADLALRASSLIQKFSRAGDVPAEGPVTLRELDTIDVTRLGDEFLGLNHSTFAQNRAVMDDLKLLLDRRLPSPRLSQIHPVPLPPQDRRYWRFE
ncbi:alpha/beta hydrolase [Bradyrhizobium sp. 83002]|uniref:alpha/beta hydrolase n=1 Tax=Bradyrhizobium aeschynomenes TaxID=2734909 RepID=UPI0015518972|nr:alpha/beta hydrolase [Bradyrhizobium aeschynomenes]NPU15676.1 alpha/beta hydrolase [Bradyrhizobium aeschynomenes]